MVPDEAWLREKLDELERIERPFAVGPGAKSDREVGFDAYRVRARAYS